MSAGSIVSRPAIARIRCDCGGARHQRAGVGHRRVSQSCQCARPTVACVEAKPLRAYRFRADPHRTLPYLGQTLLPSPPHRTATQTHTSPATPPCCAGTYHLGSHWRCYTSGRRPDHLDCRLGTGRIPRDRRPPTAIPVLIRQHYDSQSPLSSWMCWQRRDSGTEPGSGLRGLQR